jgi:hypothetical protein
MVNSLKFYHDLIFTTVNLVGHTFMQDYDIPIQVAKACFESRKRV